MPPLKSSYPTDCHVWNQSQHTKKPHLQLHNAKAIYLIRLDKNTACFECLTPHAELAGKPLSNSPNGISIRPPTFSKGNPFVNFLHAEQYYQEEESEKGSMLGGLRKYSLSKQSALLWTNKSSSIPHCLGIIEAVIYGEPLLTA